MNKTTRAAAEAFIAGNPGTFGNTTIRNPWEGATAMELHGNTIAMWSKVSNTFQTTLAGWNTPITRERLNGLLELMRERGFLAGNYLYNQRQRKLRFGPDPVASDEWLEHTLLKKED